ncbi:interferon-inducible GTPase 5-like [Hyperolius riggenbachi]|uniref:interferon-inducible GTPase 5-like n=1 Tax=Hyperolius riggenbachi TaxID=752182 RepID=UPI0035A2B979
MGNRTSRMLEENENASRIIPEEETQRMQEALVDGDIIEGIGRVKRAMEKADDVPLNIAITGDSGVGKSTFINVVRGLSDEDEGAAPTGMNQITMDPTPYPHPLYKNVIIWDLPGIGTPDFPANGYLEKLNQLRNAISSESRQQSLQCKILKPDTIPSKF